MARVTLNGINRRGLADWKGREAWVQRNVHIWSAEWRSYWRPKAQGYTKHADEAGIWSFADAYDHTKHCGPEKRIEYVSVPPDAPLPAKDGRG